MESVSWTCGARWSSQGHICGPSLPRASPHPGMFCPLGPGPAFLIPQPCRDQAFFNVPFPEHSVSPFDLSQDWAQSPVDRWLAPEVLPLVFPLCWSWAFLRGCPQEHFLPPPWGSSPEHPSYILRSQEAGEPQKRLGEHHGFPLPGALRCICALYPSVFSTCAVPAAPSQSLETCSEGGEGLGPCLPSGTAPCFHIQRAP